jgi:EAL domain-containing protein (putative c-di-GMP-specific phosphodiesterase class I)
MIRKSFEAFAGTTTEFTLNISIDDILQDETLSLIDTCLKEHHSSNVVFEILESEGIHRYDLASRFIERMKSKGCKIAIDDFGSGYSSFEHILRLHVDYLKLDSSLIKNIDTDRQSYTVVETIQNFAAKLNMETVAEFVHSKSVQDTIKGLGIHFSQGYYIGKPGPDIVKEAAV